MILKHLSSILDYAKIIPGKAAHPKNIPKAFHDTADCTVNDTQIILSHIWADNADIEIGFPGSGKVLQILNLDGLTIHNAKSNFPCLLAEVSCQQFYRCGLWGQSILVTVSHLEKCTLKGIWLTDASHCQLSKWQLKTFEKFISNVSFQKSIPGYSR